uniref:Uncharacterized protein n=1 Tax=Citrus limon TaxID=2708 RepID=A0A1S8ACB1_CITLI
MARGHHKKPERLQQLPPLIDGNFFRFMRRRHLGFAPHDTLFKTRPEIGTKNIQIAADQPLKFHGCRSSIRCRGRALSTPQPPLDSV